MKHSIIFKEYSKSIDKRHFTKIDKLYLTLKPNGKKTAEAYVSNNFDLAEAFKSGGYKQRSPTAIFQNNEPLQKYIEAVDNHIKSVICAVKIKTDNDKKVIVVDEMRSKLSILINNMFEQLTPDTIAELSPDKLVDSLVKVGALYSKISCFDQATITVEHSIAQDEKNRKAIEDIRSHI